jgi:tetratricopeptide (TPR) repeat protein
MQRDERGLPLSTDSAEAAALFDRAIEHYLKFHADTMALVAQALAADPQFLMGHCLHGYLLLSASNPANRSQIAMARATAEAGSPVATPREQRHVAALAAWARGALDQAFAIWREILDAHPTDLLALRISDTTYFRHGQTAAILAQADRLSHAWGPDLPGYDCFRTVWAFAHEEVGDTTGADRALDVALGQDRSNYFAHHVKAHVFDTECRPHEGRDWLASQVEHWTLGNNLIHHLWWHRALLELDLGELDAVLESYDTNIRNLNEPMTRAVPDHFVDLQNAASLLWRLEQQGVAVGDRWQELADKAEARIGDVGHLLLVPHLMLALAATGRHGAAERLLGALREIAAAGSLWTSSAIADVVIPVCEAVLAHRLGDHGRVVDLMASRRPAIRLLGGSNAQRDMMMQMLVDSAMRAGRRALVAEMIAHETTTRAVPPTVRAGYAAAANWLR